MIYEIKTTCKVTKLELAPRTCTIDKKKIKKIKNQLNKIKKKKINLLILYNRFIDI